MADSNITKKALASAMKSLMEKTPFSKINVADICEACDMNRKSFYYHFKDKYDLVNWIYYNEFIETLYQHTYSDGWKLLYDICQYFYDNRNFYVNALKVTGQNSFREYFHEVLKPVVTHYLDGIISTDKDIAGDEYDEYFEAFILFFTESVTGAIEKWLLGTSSANSAIPPDKFVQLLKRTITEAARKIVNKSEL